MDHAGAWARVHLADHMVSKHHQNLLISGNVLHWRPRRMSLECAAELALLCAWEQQTRVVAWFPGSFMLLTTASFFRSRPGDVVAIPSAGDEVAMVAAVTHAMTTSCPSPDAARMSPVGSRLRAATPPCSSLLAGPEFRSILLGRLTCTVCQPNLKLAQPKSRRSSGVCKQVLVHRMTITDRSPDVGCSWSVGQPTLEYDTLGSLMCIASCSIVSNGRCACALQM